MAKDLTIDDEIKVAQAARRRALADIDASDELLEQLFDRKVAEQAEVKQELVDRFNALRSGDAKLPRFETTEAEKRGLDYMRRRVQDMIVTCPDQSSIDAMRAFMGLVEKIF